MNRSGSTILSPADKDTVLHQLKQHIESGNLPDLQKKLERWFGELRKEDFSTLVLLASSIGHLEILVSVTTGDRSGFFVFHLIPSFSIVFTFYFPYLLRFF